MIKIYAKINPKRDPKPVTIQIDSLPTLHNGVMLMVMDMVTTRQVTIQMHSQVMALNGPMLMVTGMVTTLLVQMLMHSLMNLHNGPMQTMMDMEILQMASMEINA